MAAGDLELSGTGRRHLVCDIAGVYTVGDNNLALRRIALAKHQCVVRRDVVAFSHMDDRLRSAFKTDAITVIRRRNECIVSKVKVSGTAVNVDETAACRHIAVSERTAGRAGELRQTVQIRASHIAERNIVRTCFASSLNSDYIRFRTRACAREGAATHRDVVGIVVCSGQAGNVSRFRNKNEGIGSVVEVRFVVLEVDILDRQGFRTGRTTVTVDDDLARNGFVLAVDGQVQTSLLTDNRVAFDVRDDLYRHVASHLMSRIERSLERLVLNSLITGYDLRYRANQFAVHVGIALYPDIGISRELFLKLISGDRFPCLRAIIKVEVEGGSLRVNVKRAVKSTSVELRVHIGRNAVIAAVALAELAVHKDNSIHAAVRRPAMELAAAYRDRTAVAAIDVKRINRINFRVFDHKVRIAALTQHTAESPGNIGILYSKGGRSIDSIHQDRGVPCALSAAAHHDTVDHTAVSLYVNDGIVSAARNSTAVDLEILDRDVRIRKLHAIAIRGRDLDRGRVSALALQCHTRRNDCCRRKLNCARIDIDSVAGLGRIKRVHQAHIFHITDRAHADHPGRDILLFAVHIDNDLPAFHRAAGNPVIHLYQAADDRKGIRLGSLGEVFVNRVIAQVYRILKNFGSAGFLNIESRFILFTGIERAAVCSDHITRRSGLVINIDELACAVEHTVRVCDVSGISPHGIILAADAGSLRTGGVERTAGEVHITVAEQLAVNGAVFHVNGARMLEAMVVITAKVKRDILESDTIRNATDIS